MNDTYDPRAIANLMLDEADRQDIEITNLALQKLLYFAHGIHLIQTKKPLVSGYFEAWQYGPVHPSVYNAFKISGSHPIKIRATKKDLLTGRRQELHKPTEGSVVYLLQHVVGSYGRMSPGRLVDLSHATNSPWHYVVDKGRTSIAFGFRISDNVIIERFCHHKVAVDVTPKSGEPVLDAPFA